MIYKRASIKITNIVHSKIAEGIPLAASVYQSEQARLYSGPKTR